MTDWPTAQGDRRIRKCLLVSSEDYVQARLFANRLASLAWTRNVSELVLSWYELACRDIPVIRAAVRPKRDSITPSTSLRCFSPTQLDMFVRMKTTSTLMKSVYGLQAW